MLAELFSELTSNYILNVAIIAWALAQVLKVLTNLIVTRKFNLGRIIGAGGMPSSHTALTVGLTGGVFRVCGWQSPEFAIAAALTVIVMYDAAGVRRAAGEHARVLNTLIEQWEVSNNQSMDKNLKEWLGHTPIEVLGGCILGLLVVLLYPLGI